MFREGGPNVWSFTERQLRELTWTAYGTSILLFHHDFPYPLEVVFPENPQSALRIRYLPMANIPATPQDAVEQARRTTYVGQTLLAGTRPTNLEAETRGGHLLVRWLSTGAPRYRVRWENARSAPATLADWDGNLFVNTPNYTILNATPGDFYTVAVSSLPQVDVPVRPQDAIDQDATGESDDVRTTFQARFAAPAEPENVVAANSTSADGVIDLTWDDVADADGYDVQWKTEDETQWTDLPQARASSISTPMATIGTVFQFRVRAYRGPAAVDHDARGTSGWSTVVSREARYLLPGPASGLVVSRQEAVDGGLSLAWAATANAQTYDVQWESGDEGLSSANQENVATNSYSRVMPIGPSATFRVRGVRGTGQHATRGSWTVPRSGTPRYQTPARLPVVSIVARDAATETEDGVLRASWDAANLAQGFEVEWQSDDDPNWSEPVLLGPAVRQHERAFVPPNLGQFRVRSVRGPNSNRPEYSLWRESGRTRAYNRPTTVRPVVSITHTATAGQLSIEIDPGVELERGGLYFVRRTNAATGVVQNLPQARVRQVAVNDIHRRLRGAGLNIPAGTFFPAQVVPGRPWLDNVNDRPNMTDDQSQWTYDVAIQRNNARLLGPRSVPVSYRLMPVPTVSSFIAGPFPQTAVNTVAMDFSVPAGVANVEMLCAFIDPGAISSIAQSTWGLWDNNRRGPINPGIAGSVLETPPFTNSRLRFVFPQGPAGSVRRLIIMVRCVHSDGSRGWWNAQAGNITR